jgi:hypothetical protein
LAHFAIQQHCHEDGGDNDQSDLIVDDRHGTTSTMVISQLPADEWYSGTGDNTLADAILVMHNAHRLQLKEDSMRNQIIY